MPASQNVNQSSLMTLRVLEEIASRQPVSLAELAAEFDKPKTTIHRALSTLQQAGWIRSAGRERTRWVLTPLVLRIARAASDHDGLRHAARPVLMRLRDETKESTLLAVADDRRWTVVDFVEGSRTIRLTPDGVVGAQYPLHAGASGKAILASRHPADIDRYIAGGLEPVTSATVGDARLLRAQIAQIRDEGYCLSVGETLADDESAGVAAVIAGPDGVGEASVAIGLPGHRLQNPAVRTELARAVIAAAEQIARVLYGAAP